MGTIGEYKGTFADYLGSIWDYWDLLGCIGDFQGSIWDYQGDDLGLLENRIARLPVPLSLWVILSKGTPLVIEDGVEQQLAELRGLLCRDLGLRLTGSWREF